MIFTFGFGHECVCGRPLRWCYTEIEGDYETARAKMFELWGRKWAFQYESMSELHGDAWLVCPIRVETCFDRARCPCGSVFLEAPATGWPAAELT
jgi:hypothetical protein